MKCLITPICTIVLICISLSNLNLTRLDIIGTLVSQVIVYCCPRLSRTFSQNLKKILKSKKLTHCWMICFLFSNSNFVRFCLFVCWIAADFEVRFSAQKVPKFSPALTGKHTIWIESIFVEKIGVREVRSKIKIFNDK